MGKFNFKTWRDTLFKESYFAFNCALLGEANMERMLFGCVEDEKLEGLRRIAFLVGTAFLDEINTLPKGVENKFLRLLASPYEAIIHEKADSRTPTKKIEGLNILYIFASNKKPEELIEKGYNSAFIGRIRQNYFEIPPLKDRPEDIALAFSSMLYNKKDDNAKLSWQRIDLHAFRFVCMLPWEDNFRGLQGFVDSLALQRIMRDIDDPEISFEEIVECAVEKNLMTGS